MRVSGVGFKIAPLEGRCFLSNVSHAQVDGAKSSYAMASLDIYNFLSNFSHANIVAHTDGKVSNRAIRGLHCNKQHASVNRVCM